MRPKLNFFSLNEKRYVWQRANTAFQHKNLIPSVKNGGGSIMVWACFAPSGPGRLAIIDGTMSSELYQHILQENVKVSISELKLNRKWVIEQDNDPNTNQSTKEWLEQKKDNVLEWQSQSPDRNPTEILWKDLKQAVHTKKPTNIPKLRLFCKVEWTKNSSKLMCRADKQVPDSFGRSYCCKRGSHQLLKARVHILLPHRLDHFPQ